MSSIERAPKGAILIWNRFTQIALGGAVDVVMQPHIISILRDLRCWEQLLMYAN